jgi:hypothetical protein
LQDQYHGNGDSSASMSAVDAKWLPPSSNRAGGGSGWNAAVKGDAA